MLYDLLRLESAIVLRLPDHHRIARAYPIGVSSVSLCPRGVATLLPLTLGIYLQSMTPLPSLLSIRVLEKPSG